jgi:hypothetical protein
MSNATHWPWIAMLILGAGHGVNPGMGWLFAVALGLQEQKRRAVWRALLPLALGHALAIGAAVLFALLIGQMLPVSLLKWIVALTLLALGVERLRRGRHPRWGGMQVGKRDLAIWSFLMASAHGAGLMVLPFILGTAPAGQANSMHDHAANAAGLPLDLPGEGWFGLVATLFHTTGYLAVTGLLAVIVYEKLGLRLLRTMWLNLDVIWGAALILTALITPFL